VKKLECGKKWMGLGRIEKRVVTVAEESRFGTNQ